MFAENSAMPLIINMMGSICLLLWGSFTVRAAVERCFASALNQLVSRASGAPFKAVAGGIVAALLMQSATATILLATGLLSSGTLSLAATMGVILGADLGSAIATRVLSVDLSLLPPVLLVVGLCFHLFASTWRGKYVGRILIGLGLMLLAIVWMKQTITPLSASPLPDDWMSVLQSVPWFALAVVAVVTWLAHSSVAVVLVIAALAQSGLVPPSLYIPMLLGANLGAGLIALPLVGRRNPDARSVVMCNLGIRALLALAGLIAVPWLIDLLPHLGASPGTRVIMLHIGFNTLLVILFVPFAGALAGRIKNWLQSRETAHSPTAMTVAGAGLDPTLISHPTQALACARREAFRLGDLTEGIFARALGMFEATDQSQIHQIIESDREINIRNKSIHQYLSEVRRHVTDAEQELKLDQILHFASTMENIGDAVSHDLSRLATKRLDRGVMFSAAGQDEINLIHQQVLALLRLEINQFAVGNTDNLKKSQKLVAEIRDLCNQSVSHHRRRLSDHKASSVGSSSIHQDTVRDLLQIALQLEYEFTGAVHLKN